MNRIKIDRTKCISCLTCITACRVAHNGEDSRNRVVISSSAVSTPIFCRNCDLPECTYTCMTGSMAKNDQTGYVTYNKDHCANCYMCIMGCPYGTLKADHATHKYIMKCDMCTEHPTETPQCVQNCPMQAIVLEEVK